MKSILIVLFSLCLCLPQLAEAQISKGGIPFSLQNGHNKSLRFSPIPEVALQPVNMEEIAREDSVNDLRNDVPWRFGIARELDLGFENAGVWDTLADGSRLWRLKLSSAGANSINLNYSLFFMPPGAKLFVYNRRKEILGAFTQVNNKADSAFANLPVSGEEVYLEYFEPFAVLGQGRLKISHLVHGYRYFKSGNKAFNSSGYCNVNVTCPEGDTWQNEKRAVVVLVTVNNTSKCTGTLLNNVRQDGTPYILTAAHCGNWSNAIFRFDYESSTCQPSFDDTTTYSIMGGTLRSFESNYSDFQLQELSITPPDSFNVFYAGWSAENIASPSSVVIHHPSGDVKKISKNFDPVVSTGYYDDPGVQDHWRVTDWEIGTTEGGSSGAALFDENHRVVGQLHGGAASCANRNPDWFGKFSYSWDSNPLPSKQLKYWLDPDSSGVLKINAFDPDSAQFALDAEMLNVGGIPSYMCSSDTQVYVSLRNLGNDTIKHLKIRFGVPGLFWDSVMWTGNLPRFGLEKIHLGLLQLPFGKHTFIAEIAAVNNLPDQNNSNNSSEYTYIAAQTNTHVIVEVKTDDYGSETSWVLLDSMGSHQLFKKGPFQDVSGGSVYRDTLCLYEGCFKFTIRDMIGDGFNGMWGSGYYLIKDLAGDTLAFNNNFRSFSYSENICIRVNSLLENAKQEFPITLIPNPIKGENFSLSSSAKITELILLNVQGQMMQRWNAAELVDPKDLKFNKPMPGIYLLKITSEDGRVAVKKIVLQ